VQTALEAYLYCNQHMALLDLAGASFFSVETPMGAQRVADRAKSVGLSVAKIYRDAQHGKLEIRKCGRASLIFDDEWERYLAAMPVKGTTPPISKKKAAAA
jgi:hypothetical protein